MKNLRTKANASGRWVVVNLDRLAPMDIKKHDALKTAPERTRFNSKAAFRKLWTERLRKLAADDSSVIGMEETTVLDSNLAKASEVARGRQKALGISDDEQKSQAALVERLQSLGL